MKFLDLFSGVGGFRLGMEAAGHECVGHCEIDKFANKSYEAIHQPGGGEWFATDINMVRAGELPRADCWCFGFPCQDISTAGKQSGFAGKRSSLFFAATKLIKELEEKDRPAILFVENVKNLLSVNGGFDFAKLLIELDEIGYDAEWQVINSASYVPQKRERVYIVGHLRGRCTSQVFPIAENTSTAGIRQVGNCMPTKSRSNPNQGRVYDVGGLSPCLNTAEGGGRVPLLIETREKIIKRQNEPTGVWVKEATASGRKFAEVGDSINLQFPNNKTRRGRVGHQIAQTLETSCNQGTLCGGIIRKLTPREYWRLQGFPDWAFDRAREVNSDSQLYKQAGNSVTVDVIKAIAGKLEIQ